METLDGLTEDQLDQVSNMPRYELTEAQMRRLLAILRAPSPGAVVRHIRFLRAWGLQYSQALEGSKTPARDAAIDVLCAARDEHLAAMDDDDSWAYLSLSKIESCAHMFLEDMRLAGFELPSAQVRENLRDASRHVQIAVRLLRGSGKDGIATAARCMVYHWERERFYVEKLLKELSTFAADLKEVTDLEYGELSKEDRKRRKEREARTSLAARLWWCHCDDCHVSLDKRTDHRFNELARAVFEFVDPGAPRDLRGIVNAGRKRARIARETGGDF